jgi:DNA-binding response OmpR family regulator
MNPRVMIADDDPLIRRTLSSALARAGFDVCTAPDGDSAVRLAEVAVPDIAVLDLNMPMGGLEVLRALKARHGAGMFVAILSGDDTETASAHCLAAGADAVLAKPISPVDLRRRLMAAATALYELRIAS